MRVRLGLARVPSVLLLPQNEDMTVSQAMERAALSFTAVFLKSNGGYIGFIEEIPSVNAHGRTLDEARRTLVELTRLVFDEERRSARDLLAGREALREPFRLPPTRRMADPRRLQRAPRGGA